MDLSQRDLQIIEKFFFFSFVFEILTENQKMFKRMRGVNIDQISMCYKYYINRFDSTSFF